MRVPLALTQSGQDTKRVRMISQDIPGYGVGFPAGEAGHDSQHIPGDTILLPSPLTAER